MTSPSICLQYSSPLSIYVAAYLRSAKIGVLPASASHLDPRCLTLTKKAEDDIIFIANAQSCLISLKCATNHNPVFLTSRNPRKFVITIPVLIKLKK